MPLRNHPSQKLMNDGNGRWRWHWPLHFSAPPDELSGRPELSAEAMAAPLNAIRRHRVSKVYLSVAERQTAAKAKQQHVVGGNVDIIRFNGGAAKRH